MNNIKTIQVQAYTDPHGLPTCCVDMGNHQQCVFFRVLKFGALETCVFAEQIGRDQKALERREPGYLIPHENCPVWGKNEP